MTDIAFPDDYRGLLNRQLARKNAKAHMGPAYDLLHLELKYGLGILERTARSGSYSMTLDATLRLFWLYLECLDAIDQLLRNGSAVPGVVQARQLLDLGLQLLYLLGEDDVRVSACYLTWWRRAKLRANKRMAPGTQTRKEVAAELEKTRFLSPDLLDHLSDPSEHIAEVEEDLQREPWREANEELQSLGTGKRWYAAYDGPTNVKELAREVGMEAWHRFLYSPWSNIIHIGTPERALVIGPDDSIGIRPLRSPDDWPGLTLICHGLTFQVFEAVLDAFRYGGGESIALMRYYVTDLRERVAYASSKMG